MSNQATYLRGGCLPAILSLLIPGLGQLAMGKIGVAIVHFALCCLLWAVLLGWLMNIWSCLAAALSD